MGYREIVMAQLRIDEGVKAKPYKDTVGKLTVGVGRNLDDVGLRTDEIDYLLANDVTVAEGTARKLFPSFDRLSDARKAALLNMSFNLGESRLGAFKRFREAVEAQAWTQAAAEMMDSTWAKQVGQRAVRLAKAMEEG